MKFKLFFAALTCLASTAAYANEGSERYAELSREIQFSTMARTPDVLDPVIVPYLSCVNPQIRTVKPGETFDPGDFDPAPDCSAERNHAIVEGPKILSREGIDQPAMQQMLIGEALFVIDLAASSMAEYTTPRRYAADGLADD